VGDYSRSRMTQQNTSC